jgi:hypothetical protein
MERTEVIQISSSELAAFLEEASEKILISQYTDCYVGVNTLCEIWGVTQSTVSHYVTSGKITPVNHYKQKNF